MADRLTDSLVKALLPPSSGNRIVYDSDLKGFGCRLTAAGVRSFVLNYRTNAGRERRYTIGQFPTWKVTAARAEAAELKRRVDRGGDPLGEIVERRAAPTVADLCTRYEADHLPKKRPSSQVEDRSMIAKIILPAWRSKKVAEITFSDVDALHRKLADTPYRANRVVSLLSKMFGLAIKWKMRADNPAMGVERNQEIKRTRHLSGKELAGLTAALATADDKQAANIIRLLLLTGARRGEALQARWEQIDLGAGVWTKPGATTKQKTEHRVPLSAPARQLLSEIRAEAGDESVFVFPGRTGGHRVEIKKAWAAVCRAAGIEGARLHDLRHSYASILASAGLSLPVIGALLGHTQPQTTQRYAHLFDDPLRAATERVGAIVSGSPSASMIQIRRGAM